MVKMLSKTRPIKYICISQGLTRLRETTVKCTKEKALNAGYGLHRVGGLMRYPEGSNPEECLPPLGQRGKGRRWWYQVQGLRSPQGNGNRRGSEGQTRSHGGHIVSPGDATKDRKGGEWISWLLPSSHHSRPMQKRAKMAHGSNQRRWPRNQLPPLGWGWGHKEMRLAASGLEQQRRAPWRLLSMDLLAPPGAS